MTGHTCTDELRELAYRENHGTHVALHWNSRTDQLAVSVFDARTGECFELDAPRDRALDVFHHPYWYAASRPDARTDVLLAA